MEHGGSFFEVADLGFGRCKFALAVKKGSDFYSGYNIKTIATKYPNVAREYFAEKGMDIEIIKIEGSVELAPLVGLSDGIVDIVETGTTLKDVYKRQRRYFPRHKNLYRGRFSKYSGGKAVSFFWIQKNR